MAVEAFPFNNYSPRHFQVPLGAEQFLEDQALCATARQVLAQTPEGIKGPRGFLSHAEAFYTTRENDEALSGKEREKATAQKFAVGDLLNQMQKYSGKDGWREDKVLVKDVARYFVNEYKELIRKGLRENDGNMVVHSLMRLDGFLDDLGIDEEESLF